ncbi:Zinc finger protein 280A [Clonorchis sinensis]|uniref:Zinc finger protein 280A n=1 Tax=Clonorchis sinensis TaxID=79923 RepID=A0A3R7C577_CLOSI|nr:Zinc finger protein 280A [Clonorchis sinensis]
MRMTSNPFSKQTKILECTTHRVAENSSTAHNRFRRSWGSSENHSLQTTNTTAEQFVPQTASQLLMQQRDAVPVSEASDSTNARTGEHVATVGMLACRICGKEANSELALAHHLQSTHREREMPYVCRLCLFRSSLFEDILEHFKKVNSSLSRNLSGIPYNNNSSSSFGHNNKNIHRF